MRCSTNIAIAALMLSAGTAVAGGPDSSKATKEAQLAAYGTQDAAYEKHDEPKIKFKGDIQFRYNAVFGADDGTDDGNNNFEGGFQMARTRLKALGDVGDTGVHYYFYGEFSADDGKLKLKDSWASYEVADGVHLKAGQFKVPFSREFNVDVTNQLAIEQSVINSVFGLDRSQGVMVGWHYDRAHYSLAFTDGRKGLNTDITDHYEADAAFVGRGEWRFGDAGWSDYKDLTSYRGSNSGWLVGAGASWQQEGKVVGKGSLKGTKNVYNYTADVSYEGDGWNALGAVFGQTIDAGSGDYTDYGVLVQGGYFVDDHNEVFARYGVILPDSDRATDDAFSQISVGWNHYVVPESQSLKLSAEVLYYPEALANTSELVSADEHLPLLGDTNSDQLAIVLQLQLVF